ncbi:MAG: neutral/alkaline non-lysosomal ceramidase N-terminal domain-containing protein [Phycisphaerae bacterium]|nr:neutral/alkaline non-lysosomal ceramidase N-terminal domain-containing protein [Phycisphaerae bacterium]
MFKRVLISLLLVLCINSQIVCGENAATDWRVGVASAVITPDQPMWMAGYAARDKPSEGKVHDLHAKALAIEDAQGTRLVIVTVDLLGLSRSSRDWLEKESGRRFNLPPEGLLLNASHTHCGPALHETRFSIYGDTICDLSPEQTRQSKQYLEGLHEKILHVVGAAIESLAPARLSYSHARAGFAMNRRWRVEGGHRIQPNPDGPVDHDVPVLRVDSPDGKLQAVLFGYACHCTTLSFYEFCGDYAGFAQEYIEQAHPGVTALFMAGCGGDQNPYPRGGPRTLEYCREHGRALANGVETALTPRAVAVAGPIRAAIDTVTLEFAEPPSRALLEEQLKSSNKYARGHAQVLLDELEQAGRIGTTYPYLVQVIEFGEDLTMIALAGEVVVDYSLRLKAELTGRPVWVAGYCNDVFGYLPSVRVLQEGGYEAGDAMLYTPLPGPFAPSVEKLVVDKVHELVRRVRVPKDR